MDETRWIRKPEHGVSVVFIHGILSSSDSAWRNKNGTWWPDLLKAEDDLKEIGIYVFDYRSDALSANYNLFDAVTSLKDRLERDGLLASRRLIFVCHSMGGIVARKFLVQYQVLLSKRPIEIGLFLVASPSLGSQLAEGPLVKTLARAFGNTQAEALRFAQNNVWLNELDRSFTDLKDSGLLPLAGKELFEDEFAFLPWLFRRQVVEPFSGARYFPDAFKVPYSNHQSIAKPENRNARQHELLCDFIRKYRYTSGQSAFRKVDLKIGLSSESPETVSWMLGICRQVMNVVLRRPDNLVPFNIDIEAIRDYDQAFATFDAHLEQYDIVMLDDLWLPRFERRLIDLNTLDAFQDYFGSNPFQDVFLESLTGVCTRRGAPDNVFAIPVSGNVQLLMYRRDLIATATGTSGESIPFGTPDELLEFLLTPGAKAAADVPFVVRYETDNDIAENFWEILRAYGYEDMYGEGGDVLIPATLANKALEWIQRAHPGGSTEHFGWEKVSSLTSAKSSDAMMMFGWPVWIMADLIRRPDACRWLGMKQFIPHPITGFWSLAIPETSRNPEEAMKVILALTTVPELQLFMGEAGLVPVLREFSSAQLKKNHPAWKAYFDIVRDALRSGRPRPRSGRWREIERELAQQIRNGQFSDHAGLFRFAPDVEQALT